jgi:hypothetical protein
MIDGQGPKGDVGPMGPQGEMGPAGPAGSSVQVLSFPVFPVEPQNGNLGPGYPWLGSLIPYNAIVTGIQISGDITGAFQYRITTGAQIDHPSATKVTPVIDPTWTVNAASTQIENVGVIPSQLATANSLDDDLGTWDVFAFGAGPQLFQYNWQAGPVGTIRFNRCYIKYDTSGSNGGTITFSYIPKGETGNPGNYVLFATIGVPIGVVLNQSYTAYIGTAYDWEWADGVSIDIQCVGAGNGKLQEFDMYYFTEAQAVNATLDTALTGWDTNLTAHNVLSAIPVSVVDRVDDLVLDVEITAT